MKILIISLNFAPDLTGIGKYSGELALWLSNKKHEIRVITAPPYYPDWKIGKGYKSWFWQFEKFNEINIWRCPIWIPSRPGGLSRIFHLFSFALTSIPIALLQVLWKPHIVIVIEPPLFVAPLALIVAKYSRSCSILHIQDYEVDAAFDLGILRGSALKNLALSIESFLMRSFDVVSTISKNMALKAIAKNVQKNKVLLAPNWVNVTDFNVSNSIYERFKYREYLQIPQDKLIALYSGNMGAKQGLDILADLANLCELASLPVFFVFCGNGVGRSLLIERTLNLTNIKFLELQPADMLPKFFNMVDVHLLPQRADVADLVMPSKLTGMLASGRPVLAMADSGTELATVLEGCGIVVEPGNSNALFSALKILLSDSALRDKLGSSGKIYAQEKLDRDKLLSEFECYLLRLVEQKV